MRRKVSVFGSTGSVGQNTVALIAEQGGAEAFEVVALTGSSNVALLAEQARSVGARIAVTADEAQLAELRRLLAGTDTVALGGEAALIEAADEPADWTMSSIVGAAGLAPGIRSARHGGVLALANKESLVCAGELLRATCERHCATLIPVDSEHSAIFQALRGESRAELDRIILTASGGPFRDWTQSQMASVTPEQARSHPNWDMGYRISVDSASMFNKALEMIEAQKLFAARPDQIEVIVHPQSVVHSMVGFTDGAIIAHLGPSDMRGAIGFALNWPDRKPLGVKRLDFAQLACLDFAEADEARFPALRLAREVMEMGGLSGAVFNAAKEEALTAFISHTLGFLDMAILVEDVLGKLGPEAAAEAAEYDLDTVLAYDRESRRMAKVWIEAFIGA